VSTFEIFTGDVNEHVAHIFARYDLAHDGSQRLTGRVRGPFNHYAHTLPANVPWQDLGPGDSLLARAVVTDPCPWSPDSPALYQSRLERIAADGSILEQEQCEFGIRRFGVRERGFRLGARAWVMRGVYGEPTGNDEAIWREQATTRIICTDDEKFLATASQRGLPVVIDWSHRTEVDCSELQLLARFPCVFLVVLSPNTVLPNDIKASVPNLLLAQALRLEDAMQPWADVAWLTLVECDEVAALRAITLPTVIVRRTCEAAFSVARADCDRLQATLAPYGQFAGYVV
jgi:Glycosyl hydrolases family 2